jgi:hypothetical protein
MVVQAFLAEHGKARAEVSYAMQLMLFMRWLGVRDTVGWDELPSDNLRLRIPE